MPPGKRRCICEDFLFGTPLSAEARLAHEEAKQGAALRLWSAASRAASNAGDAAVAAARIDGEAAAIVVPTQRDDGRIRLELAAGPVVEIESRRLEQYASIAYSLRAILAVDQEQLLTGGDPLRPLSSDGVDALDYAINGLFAVGHFGDIFTQAHPGVLIDLAGRKRFPGFWGHKVYLQP